MDNVDRRDNIEDPHHPTDHVSVLSGPGPCSKRELNYEELTEGQDTCKSPGHGETEPVNRLLNLTEKSPEDPTVSDEGDDGG